MSKLTDKKALIKQKYYNPRHFVRIQVPGPLQNPEW